MATEVKIETLAPESVSFISLGILDVFKWEGPLFMKVSNEHSKGNAVHLGIKSSASFPASRRVKLLEAKLSIFGA